MKLFNSSNTEFIFKLLTDCKDVVSDNIHHPEKDVLEHSLQTFNLACRESSCTDTILAALLHDVGKPINPLGHDKIACEILNEYVSAKTLFIIENHMRIKLLLDGKMKKKSKILFLTNHTFLPELILLSRWDVMGRNSNIHTVFNKYEITDKLNYFAVIPRRQDE